MADTVVVGLDFSDTGGRAFEAALRLAQDLDTRLVLVHALGRLPRVPGPRTGMPDPITEVEQEVQTEEAVELSTVWARRARDRGLEVDTVAEAEEAPELLLRVAGDEDARLLVLGTHGRSGLRRLVLGSVAEQVVRRSPVPVIVVPPARDA